MKTQNIKTTLGSALLTAALLVTTLAAEAQVQQAKIPSNFDTSVWVVPTENLPLANYPRAWGEFPHPCSYANYRYDDPIQKPGQFDGAPLNMFFGNTRTNANSTYETLRTTGEGTCFGGPVNRSAYYMPAMMTASGQVVPPDFIDVFYRGTVSTVPFPRGLKMMIGPKYMDQSYQWDVNSVRYAWSFGGEGGWWGKTYQTAAIFKNFSAAAYPDWSFQNTGYRLSIRVVAPDCWDGVHLDMPDHFSHLNYSAADATVTANCPSTHPIKIPQATITVYYDYIDRNDLSGWYLSSDRFGLKNDPAGSNFYVGMIPAWDDDVMSTWVTKVLNANLFGAFGKIGDGRRLELPPTTKIYGPTQNISGRAPLFLWNLSGMFPGADTSLAFQRLMPPSK